RNLGNLNVAKQYYKSALELVKKIDNQLEIASLLNEIGIICKDQGQLTVARAYCEQALALLKKEDAADIQASVLFSLALILELMHDIQRAQEYYQQALQLYRLVGNWENAALTLHNLGQLSDNQNDLQDALEYYFQSLAINLKYQYIVAIADNLSALASLISTVYQIIENLEQQADNPLENIPLKFWQIMSAWRQMLEEAIIAHDQKIKYEYLDLIYALTSVKDLQSAIKMHKQVLKFNQKIGYHRGQIKILIDLSLLVRDAKKLDLAQEYLTQALSIAGNEANPDDLYNIYFNRGDICMMADQVAKAINDYKAGVEIAESIRANLLLEQEALDYFAWPNLTVYDRLVRILSRLGNHKEALDWVEKAKSREFLRRLRLSEIKAGDNIPNELINREMQIIKQLRQAATKLEAIDKSELMNVLRNYQQLEKNLYQLWNEIEGLAPEYVALRQGNPASWQDLQKCLKL
ncbi:MAG: tetratricopeptide repeat protein, partial [Sphaerospermopsis sp. SIO1G2]|nr:tetratricopeptide repeat protein [Sphaerospermopsis sp. SIO1G2]